MTEQMTTWYIATDNRQNRWNCRAASTNKGINQQLIKYLIETSKKETGTYVFFHPL